MHNGKLWCCTKCIMDGKWSGNTKYQEFKKKHNKSSCETYEGELLAAKQKWGKNCEDKHHMKPYGCPAGHEGPAIKPDNFKSKPKIKPEPESPPRKVRSSPVTEPVTDTEEAAPVKKSR